MQKNIIIYKNKNIEYIYNNKMETLESLLNLFFSHQIKIKILHFQTKSYAIHKATDGYLSQFADNLDKFFEVTQGAFGKLNMKQVNMTFQTVNDDTITEELANFIKILKKIDKAFSNYSEIMNIRDEIVAEAEKLNYLLTFK